MVIMSSVPKYTVIDYKGKKHSFIPQTFSERMEVYEFEERYGQGKRNNDPENPRIPKVGDKVRLDICCFGALGMEQYNGAVGIIVGKEKHNFFVVKINENKVFVKPHDIQWYFD